MILNETWSVQILGAEPEKKESPGVSWTSMSRFSVLLPDGRAVKAVYTVSMHSKKYYSPVLNRMRTTAQLLVGAVALIGPAVARVPVYVMLPLDTVTNDLTIKDANNLKNNLNQLKSGGVEGVMCDCWWGLVEQEEKKYEFDVYKDLAQMVADAGLKMEFVMSFHSCGGNTGDECDIPLPQWALNSGSDLWYVDQSGNQDKEYMSLFADDEAMVGSTGRTPIEVYGDYMTEFTSAMSKKIC